MCCLNCEAGEYVKAPCTEAWKKGTCEKCDDGTFTEHANGLQQCFPCTQCRPEQEMVSPCTSTQNAVCQCKPGWFCRPDQACEICKKCSRCKSDEETVRNCTSTTDTECRIIQPKSVSDSDTAVIICVVVGVLLVLCAGAILFAYKWKKRCRTDFQRSPLNIMNGTLEYSEVSGGCKHPPGSEDEIKMLCESLSSSASNSQHSLTGLPCSAASASSPWAPAEPRGRVDEPFPTLVPVDGVNSLKQCFDFFEELDIDYHLRFFRSLGLNDNVIKSKASLPYEDKVHELLTVWVEQKGRDASLNDLLRVLLDYNQRRTAETVKEKAVQSGFYCCDS
ncbi:tumor necrosis factor receptor superfamily member 10A isoform X2 [Kryptolebias marmoratus]|nr:tumor necrosis factor receptor superfamily member 10A isoform X2 [Kryptolebias marmoratus]